MVTQQLLDRIAARCAPLFERGAVATYIPELSKADPTDFALATTDARGQTLATGCADKIFPLESIGKVVSLAVALSELGTKVFDHVGVSAIADPFNSILRLEMDRPHRPHNPMINSGAIVVCSLLPTEGVDAKVNSLLSMTRRLSGDDSVEVIESVYLSEKHTSDRNRALAYFLRSVGSMEGDIENTLDVYFQCCSIGITSKALSVMAATLAMDGINPVTGKRAIKPDVARACRAVMTTCGMYDGSGEFALQVGMPAKSGVGGGIMACVPHKIGVAAFGPALDSRGNSVCGLEALRLLSEEGDLRVL